MNFERGKDPMDSLDIGIRVNAKTIWAIFIKTKDRSPEGPLEEGLIRLNSQEIPRILESFRDNPNKILKYSFNQIHKGGLLSGPHEFIYEMGSYVKYGDKYYHIPVAEWEKVMEDVINA